MSREAFLAVTQVHEIGDAVIVAIRSAGVWDTVVLRKARLLGAQVIIISHPVAVPVWAAAQPRDSWLVQTSVIPIANPVAVNVGAAPVLGQTPLLGAVVIGVQNTIAIKVSWHRTAIIPPTWFSGAGIFGVGHPIPIGVWATFGQRRTRFLGAHVGCIANTIAITIPLARCGTAVAFEQARFVGAGIRRVPNPISIPVRTAVGGLRPPVVGTQVDIIADTVPVPVRELNGLHIERGMGADIMGIESPDGQSVSAG